MNKLIIVFLLSLLSFTAQAEPTLWACRNDGVTMYLSTDDDSGEFVLFNDRGQYIASDNLEIITVNNKRFYMAAIEFTDTDNKTREIMLSITINNTERKTLLLELKGSGREDNPIFALVCV